MSKNIIIFSDGTGQAGGITFDEARTNIYKLYRACRVGPDPTEQVAFYDPGLGSPADGSQIKVQWARSIYNLVSKATGLGITANIIDCYAALIRLYRHGDRVFLIGFSRGAYTVRSLAGVMSFCGIPRHLPDRAALPMDLMGSRQLASRAVKDVYQFCSSYEEDKASAYLKFMLATRRAIGAKFRAEHGCSVGADVDEKANVFPYFIGVFDTVAALGHRGLAPLVSIATLASPLILSAVLLPLSYLPWVERLFGNLSYWKIVCVVAPVVIAGIALAYLSNYLKWAPPLQRYDWRRRLKTVHFARWKHQFYDKTLNVNVGYAKHALSIDENRADFKQVPWIPIASKATTRDPHGNLYFEQVWFPGVHADIGGGYEENEARLSDVALAWMLAAASVIPDGLKHDPSVLRLHPDAAGPQHDEQKGGWLAFGLRKIPGVEAIMHKSVYRRFAAGPVILFDQIGQYRPANMNKHVDFVQYYDPSVPDPHPADPPTCDAMDIETTWQQQVPPMGPLSQ
jgi:Uncharacterized alpha/beta hydrolase domain (DUF2235)